MDPQKLIVLDMGYTSEPAINKNVIIKYENSKNRKLRMKISWHSLFDFNALSLYKINEGLHFSEHGFVQFGEMYFSENNERSEIMKKHLFAKLAAWVTAAMMAAALLSGTAFAGFEIAYPDQSESLAPVEETLADDALQGESPAGESQEGESPEGESPEGESPAGESQEGESPEGESPAGSGAGGGPQMAFVSDGMVPASESLISTIADSDGGEAEAYSLTGYNRSITLEDGSTYFFDKDSLYLGYSIVDGQPVAADSNKDVEALEVVDGVYQMPVKDIVIGDKYSEVYLKGEDSKADISGLLVMESQLEEGQSGLPYLDEEGNLITANSDMSAAGAAIVCTNGGKAYVHDLDFTSNGFAHSLAVVWGDGEHSTLLDIRNSNINTLGADPISQTPEGFLNGGLDFNTMICPPWVLGLFGGTRTLNVLNNKATLNVIDSTIGSAGWAILSSDSCSDPVFNIVDSTLVALTSDEDFGLNSIGFVDGGFDILGIDGYTIDGVTYPYGVAYGAYAIGNSREFNYGVQVLGTTYATISTGSAVTNYYSSNGDIDLVDAIDYDEATDSFTKTAETIEGKGDISRIYSVFGFMSHGNGDIGVYDGTEVHTEDAVFLYRNGDLKYTVDNAVLDTANGVILQMMDNDDAQAGGPAAQELIDMAGFPVQEYESEEGDSNGGNHTVEFELANGTYDGSLYNATGWYHNDNWGQDPDALDLVIDNATLNGGISKTKIVHAVPYHEGIEDEIAARNEINSQYNYKDIEYVYLNDAMEVVEDAADAAYVQFTYFTKLQYYLLGHVINQATEEGKAVVDVTLQNGAVWNVTEPSYITTLTVDDTSAVNGIITEIDGGYLVEPVNADRQGGGLGTELINAGVDISGGEGDSEGGSGSDGGSGSQEAAQPKEAVVIEAGEYKELSLEENQEFRGPNGEIATITVDGVETDVKEGETLKGNILVTLTDEEYLSGPNMGQKIDYEQRAALYYYNSELVESKSVQSAVNDNVILSEGTNFNGIMVTGDDGSTTDISGYDINFTGWGENDMGGVGAALYAVGNDMTVNFSDINVRTYGATRTAAFTGGDNAVNFNNVHIYTHSGDLPEGTGDLNNMEVPWMLGLVGTCRATNALGGTVSTWNNSSVVAYDWGALSTDSLASDYAAGSKIGNNVNLVVNNSYISTLYSGYGAYADGGAVDEFYDSCVDVADIAVIMTGNGVAKFENTKVNAGASAVMVHAGGGGTIIAENSDFHVGGTAFQIKDSMMTVNINNSTFAFDGTAEFDPDLAAAYGVDVEDEIFDYETYSRADFNDLTATNIVKVQHNCDAGSGSDNEQQTVQVNVKDCDLTGDFLNTCADVLTVTTFMMGNEVTKDRPSRSLEVTLENSSVNGAISLGQDEWSTYILKTISGGENEFNYASATELGFYTDGEHGLKLNLVDSKWTVTQDSYLTELTIDEGSVIEGTITIDGQSIEPAAGEYVGEIVVSPIV